MPGLAGGIAAVLLAAGGGSRLGGGKLLLPWRGRPLIAHLLRTVAAGGTGLLSLTVVLGHEADAVRTAVEGCPTPPFPLYFAVNHEWREGQSESLRCGLQSVLAGLSEESPVADHMRGALFLLADQPLIKPETLRMLIDAHRSACSANPAHPATVPLYGGQRGNPVIISPHLFPAMLELRGDNGARGILQELGSELLRVPVDDPGVLHDVDTPEAYAALLALDGSGSDRGRARRL